MAKQFEGKVVLVTGGGSGIGRATALAFAREGANVAVADRRLEGLEQTVKMIKTTGGEACAISADLDRVDDVAAMVKKTVESYGRLDIAFNNAGVGGRAAPLAEQTVEEFDRIISTNLRGVFLCMKYEIPEMLKHGSGSIVNCGSVAGLRSQLGAGVSYCASKAGLVGLTKTAALEYAATGLRINMICLGTILTEGLENYFASNPHAVEPIKQGIPVGRIGMPEEAAAAVMYLCSEQATYVCGHALVVDGGKVA